MEKRPDLQTAIEGLYQAFSRYSQPEYTDPCLHCHTLDDDALLRSTPLRQLSVEELDGYANDALTTWGGIAEFKHFLPRIFELYFCQSGPTFAFLDPEILFAKFRYGQWLTWPTQEQGAVRRVLNALWSEVLGDPPPSSSFTDVQSWLCSIAQAEDDLEPYLRWWIDDSRTSASLALSSMLLTDEGRNAFWNGRESQYEQLESWRKSQAVIAKLERALASAPSEATKNEFIAALGSIGLPRL